MTGVSAESNGLVAGDADSIEPNDRLERKGDSDKVITATSRTRNGARLVMPHENTYGNG